MNATPAGERLGGSTAPSRPNVALVSVGDPESPATWSGVTAGVLGGLRGLDVAVRPIDLKLPGGLEQALLAAAAAPTRNRYDAEGARLTTHVRSMLARRGVNRFPLDGVIQIGTTFELPRGTRYVTLEDMTLLQAGSGHPVFSRMSRSAIDSWERRRAEIYERAVMCAVASRWAGESLCADYGVAPARVAVVGFGANHSTTVPGRDWRSPRFLFVGIDWERKGGPLVLSAFSRLRGLIPDAALDVVGGHPPLTEPGVNGHGVLSQARREDRETVAELFRCATCFVMPSRIEPFGIAYVEAASAGVPSIGSSVGGPRDVIGEDGGIVVDPHDEQGLFEAMLRLADPDTARRMGSAARERSALYTWPKVAERLLRALELQAPHGRELAPFL
jgi:hypothetical protein